MTSYDCEITFARRMLDMHYSSDCIRVKLDQIPEDIKKIYDEYKKDC